MSNNNTPPDILLYGVLVYDLLETLQRKLTTPAVITRLKENVAPDVLAAHTSRADVVIALQYSGMQPAPNLRLLQIPGAGMDQINFAEVPPQARVCNAYGHDVAGGEYVVMAMLAWCHEFVSAHESMRGGTPKHRAPTATLTALWNLCRLAWHRDRCRPPPDCGLRPWRHRAPYRRGSAWRKFLRGADTESRRSIW